jgi:hypothetical protein
MSPAGQDRGDAGIVLLDSDLLDGDLEAHDATFLVTGSRDAYFPVPL